MNIYIPCPKCAPEVDIRVINSILEQTESCDPVVVVGVQHEGVKIRGVYNAARLLSEVEVRKMIQRKAAKDKDEFVGMIDKNVVFLDNKAVEKMKKILVENPKAGIVAIRFKEDRHIRFSPAIWRRDCLVDAVISMNIGSFGCICNSVIDSLKGRWEVAETWESIFKKV